MFERGLVVGKFAPLHRGHQLLIETAISECRSLTVMVYSRPDFVAMPQAVRAAWISAIYPRVDVHAPADPPLDAAGDAVQRAYVRDYLAKAGIVVDAVFTSEDYGDGFAAVLGVPHRSVDRLRQVMPVSGSAIRRDPGGNGSFLHPVVLASIRDARGLDQRR
jgi:HTH-type transcriptional repressor of NAD biosynthesis genes